MMVKLTITRLKKAAAEFATLESTVANTYLYGTTDGKAIGTYIEHKFVEFLEGHYLFERGSSAKGIDLPGPHILTDIKVTSKRQPQSSCPYRDSKQKIFGLGYNLLVFVYDKTDDLATQSARLEIVNCTFLDKERTADFTTTFRLREMLEDGANVEDVAGYLNDLFLVNDEEEQRQLATLLISSSIPQGYLGTKTRLPTSYYTEIMDLQSEIPGISRLV